MQITKLAILLVLGAFPALAHVGAPGIDYGGYKHPMGAPCCDERDCHPADDFIELTERGQPVVRLLINGQWITVPRAFVVAEDASDGSAHWCGGWRFTNSHLGPAAFPWCVILSPRGI
jgi:hypothetical protein